MDEFGQGLDERGVRVVKALELEEGLEQRAPFALRGSDGEQNEDGVVAGAGDFDMAGVEEFGEDRAGDSPVGTDALGVDAGGKDGDLGGVEHASSHRRCPRRRSRARSRRE